MQKTKSQAKNQNLPKGWRKVKLGEVASIKNGKSNSVDAVENGKYVFFDRSQKIKRSDKYLFDCEAIIVPGEGKEFLPRYFFGKFDLHQRVYAIYNFSEKVFPKFLFYFLVLNRKYFSQVAVGSTVKSLRLRHFTELPLVLPPLNEQKRIADILSAFDDKIELNNKINQTLEKMAQAIFKKWFICGKKLKVKSKKVKLCEVVKTQYGYTESASDRPIGPKFLRVTDINKTDWIDWSTVPYCRILDKEFSKYKLRKGDIVIARMADPGKVGIIEENIDAVFGSYLIRLQITSNTVTPYFLFYYLCSPLYQNFIFGASTGTTRRSINAWVMTNVELILPAREKILRFDKVASIIREKIKSNVKENQKLTALRDLILPKLISGEIRV